MAALLATHATPPGWLQGLLGVVWLILVFLISLAVYVRVYVSRVRQGRAMGTSDDKQFPVEYALPMATAFVLGVSASISMGWPGWIGVVGALPLIWLERWLAGSLSLRVLAKRPPAALLPQPPDK